MNEINLYFGDTVIAIYPGSGNFDYNKNWNETAHFHAYFEAHLIKEGNLSLMCGDNEIYLKSGDICLFCPNVSHYTFFHKGEIQKYSFCFSVFKNNQTENVKKDFSEFNFLTSMLSGINNYIVFSNQEIFKQLEYVQKLNPLDKTNLHRYQAYFSVLFIELEKEINKVLLFDEKKTTVKNESEYFVKQKMIIETFFYDNYANKVSVSDLAQKLFLSTCQTNRIVKKIFGLNFKEVLVKQRIENACMLLRKEKISLEDIAIKCGYQSYNGFLLAFKKSVGKTPEEYRKNILTK